jgi:hypothetical protein
MLISQKFSILFVILVTVLSQLESQPVNKLEMVSESYVWTMGELNPYSGMYYIENVEIPWAEASESLKKGWKNFTLENYSPPKFDLPLKLKDGIDDIGFYTISAYVDHDQFFPGHLLDYACGDLTYDLSSGFNHTGTDFFVWPFPWKRMYNDEVEVIAAAPGILYWKQDGNFDQHCEDNEDPWNGVAILHEDGSTSWYIHLKKNSLTEKFVGEEIAKGEYLGVVGSSGSSLAPHLHFEVYDGDGNLVDPFYGDCNTEIGSSWWNDQMPYKEPAINRITTNDKLPVFPECPEEEIPNEKNQFYPGDTIYLLSYFKNISLNDLVEVSIYRPDNSLFYSWEWNSPWPFYFASWLYFFIIVNEEDFGDWTYRINYAGEDYEAEFKLILPQRVDIHSNKFDIVAYPNPVAEVININFTDRNIEKINFRLFDLTGKKELDNKNFFLSAGVLKIDLSFLEKGIYFLEIYNEKFSSTIKVVK